MRVYLNYNECFRLLINIAGVYTLNLTFSSECYVSSVFLCIRHWH